PYTGPRCCPTLRSSDLVAPVAAILLAGALLGAVGPVASTFDNAVCRAVGVVFSVGWSWACFAFLAGLSRRSRIEASLLRRGRPRSEEHTSELQSRENLV